MIPGVEIAKFKRKEEYLMKSLMRWDPFRMMRRWDPFDELRSMQHEMDRLFDRFLGGELPGGVTRVWTPSIESYMKDGKLVFRAELPGVDPKDLDVSISEHELVIKGERKQEKGSKEENYVYREIAYGSFERRYELPEGVKTDELKAKFSNGILEVTLPALAITKARKIEIEVPKEEHKVIEAEAKKAA
jgi:HSP20 family protein